MIIEEAEAARKRVDEKDNRNRESRKEERQRMKRGRNRDKISSENENVCSKIHFGREESKDDMNSFSRGVKKTPWKE